MPASRALSTVLAVRLPTSGWRRPRPSLANLTWVNLADARRALTSAPSWHAPSSIGSYRSVSSVFSAASLFSVGSFLSVGSAGSILSVGSAGSILSIGSSGSILSIGASGGFAQIGSRRRGDESTDDLDAELRVAPHAPVRSIRPT